MSKIQLIAYNEYFLKLLQISPDGFKAIVNRFLKKKFHLHLYDGTKFAIDPHNVADLSMLLEVYGMQYYNPPLFEIQKNDIVFDIGAHVGYFSLYASDRATHGKVYSFEPLPETFGHLENHIESNHRKNIVALNLAVGWSEGEVDFYIFDGHNGCHSLYARQENQKILKVQKKTLEGVMKDEGIKHIDFLKLDCEWAEYEILLNLPKEVFAKIGKISMELHPDIVEWMTDETVLDCLHSNGFITSSRNGYIYAINPHFKK